MPDQAGRAARGAAWLLGGQVAVVLVQLFYTALTGRLIPPEDFGAYAVAVSIAPLVLMLATAGIGNAAARASQLTDSQVRALATVSLGLGLLASGIVVLFAEPWSMLWGNPQAVDAMRYSALGILPAPYLGLLVGLVRRSGQFRQLSLMSTASGLLGMAIGAAFVWHFRSTASLLTMSIVTTAIQTVLLMRVVGRKVHPGPLRFDVIEHLRFGAKVVASNGIGYLTVTAPQLALSRGVGAAMLGSWNRASVVTQVPIEMIQTSLVQVLYPEFRHDISTTKRASKLWLDLLALAVWVMLPLGFVAAAGAYYALPLILGPGWQTAATLSPWLAITAAVNVPNVVLGSALEATGRFDGVWPPRIASLVIMAGAAALTLASHVVWDVIIGSLVAALASHALQLRHVHQSNIFPVATLLRIYLKVILFSGALGLVTALCLNAIWTIESLALRIVPLLGMMVFSGAILWYERLRLPPITIARRYGLFTELSQL